MDLVLSYIYTLFIGQYIARDREEASLVVSRTCLWKMRVTRILTYWDGVGPWVHWSGQAVNEKQFPFFNKATMGDFSCTCFMCTVWVSKGLSHHIHPKPQMWRLHFEIPSLLQHYITDRHCLCEVTHSKLFWLVFIDKNQSHSLTLCHWLLEWCLMATEQNILWLTTTKMTLEGKRVCLGAANADDNYFPDTYSNDIIPLISTWMFFRIFNA